MQAGTSKAQEASPTTDEACNKKQKGKLELSHNKILLERMMKGLGPGIIYTNKTFQLNQITFVQSPPGTPLTPNTPPTVAVFEEDDEYEDYISDEEEGEE
jgi:hypothetical protein